jgi:hypothetical protein
MPKIDERIEALAAKLKVEQGDFVESVLRGWLDVALTRADDRALCELSANP